MKPRTRTTKVRRGRGNKKQTLKKHHRRVMNRHGDNIIQTVCYYLQH